MNVYPNPIGFAKLLGMRKATKRIVLHHSASGIDTTLADINRWHVSQGWSGIGYHYVIYASGDVWGGRPEASKGSHAYQDAKHEANSDGIGICLIGNFQTAVPTAAQMDSLVWLIQDIWSRYPGIPVIGHKDVMATACPGAMFPWAELTQRLEESKVIYKTLADVPDWGKPVVQRLMARKSLQGDEKGNLNLSDDLVRTLVILEREGVIK